MLSLSIMMIQFQTIFYILTSTCFRFMLSEERIPEHIDVDVITTIVKVSKPSDKRGLDSA